MLAFRLVALKISLIMLMAVIYPALSVSVNASGFPHVAGNKMVDENGQTLLLHGAQLEGELNGSGNQVSLNYSKIVSTMAAWKMNAIRLPSCNWYWKADPAGYMSKIQNAVSVANQAGLYVIIDLHDDHNCSPPYPWPEPYHLPRPEMDTYWQAVASTLKNNPRVIFDIYNEPNIQAVGEENYTDAEWKLWLNGGTVNDSNGTETFIGMEHLVNVIRQTGAQQIIMAEGYTTAETFHNIGANTLNDPLNNIVYEAHKYALEDGAAQWDTDFGFMASNYPVFVGEWALMGGDNAGQTNCGNVSSPSQADQVVKTFLGYMDSRHMGWTAYSFDAEHLIVDYTNFTPTTFFQGWICPVRGNNTINHAGMGMDVKTYLSSFSFNSQPGPAPSPGGGPAAPGNNSPASKSPSPAPNPSGGASDLPGDKQSSPGPEATNVNGIANFFRNISPLELAALVLIPTLILSGAVYFVLSGSHRQFMLTISSLVNNIKSKFIKHNLL